MNTSVTVSVVMGVYNGAGCLPGTIESILQQQAIELELVIVNDGSTDDTARVIDEYARNDSRVRAIHKRVNAGLTFALKEGCAAATGPLIARQDCGDRSLPQRLACQATEFEAQPALAMLGGGTRLVTDGEVLLENRMSSTELQKGLSGGSMATVFGPPHHGGTMFRRQAYEQVGGYRPEFYFAQDLDLWLRLAEIGPVACLESVVYEAALDAGSISGKYRREQEQLKELAIRCRKARLTGQPEQALLQAARQIRPEKRSYDASKGDYFIARLLETVNPDKALLHYKKALSKNPLNWKALIRQRQLQLKMILSSSSKPK